MSCPFMYGYKTSSGNRQAANDKRQGRLLTLPEMLKDNAYFLNLLLIATRPMKQGPKRSMAPGIGAEFCSNAVTP